MATRCAGVIFVIGSRGRLGQALCATYRDCEVICLHREIYQHWWKDSAVSDISRCFQAYRNQGAVVFVASGLLDPAIPLEEHLKVNYLLPKNVIEGVCNMGIRVVTFGTIMELIIADKNPYIQSKKALGEYVQGHSNTPITHIRVHTLYGSGKPHSFMFLGQIYIALKHKTIFRMSAGNQLREYHHIDDDTAAVRLLVDSQLDGIVDLNHGGPVRLKEIAQYVFKAFNLEDLLHIGALPSPKAENYGATFERPTRLSNVQFRPALPAIVTYLEAVLG